MTTKIMMLSFLLSLSATARADEPNTVYTYRAEATGLMCSACGKKVKSAMETLPGVKMVKITPGETQGISIIVIQSTSSRLTKDDAVKALGKDSASYSILTLKSVRSSPLSPK